MDLYDTVDLITKGLTFNLIVSVIIYGYLFLRKRKLSSVLFFYIGSCLLFDVINYLSGRFFGFNHFLIPLFGIFDFIFWTLFFLEKDKRQEFHYKKILYFYLLIVFVEIYFLFFKGSFLPIPSRSLGYALLLYLITRLFLISNYEQIKSYKGILFWVVFYTSFGCIYYLLLSFSVYWANNLKFILWLLQSILLHFFYIAITYYQWSIGKTR